VTTAPPWVELLAAMLRESPALPNALCRNDAALFDGDDPADIADAIELCLCCPVLERCRAHHSKLPPKAVSGIVGGEYRPFPEKATSTRQTVGSSSHG
jgi:hypothetical protein